MLLVHVCQFHGLADSDVTAVRLLQTHNESEQCRLAGTVRTDHADDTGWRKHERKMLEQQFVAISLGNIIELNDLVAELRSVRDIDFEIGLLLPAVLAG